MSSRILVAPSILSADFSRLADEIRRVEEAGADWIHCDIMDGHFVDNISFGPAVVKTVRKLTTLPLDVHLMIKHADHFVPRFVEAGANSMTMAPLSSSASTSWCHLNIAPASAPWASTTTAPLINQRRRSAC